jgi:branched-chain amino acid transport system substrate-binding protein
MVGKTSKLRYGAVVAAGTTILAGGAGCGTILQSSEPESVVIGVDLELTGAGADLGEALLTALELQADRVNDQGLLGDRELVLQVLDNRSDQSTSATNLTTLADDSSVTAIIAGPCDPCTLGAVEQLNQRAVPTISLGRADAIAEPVAERRYIFKLGPDAGSNAALIGDELEQAEVATMALVTAEDPYSEDGVREMTATAGRAGIDVVVDAQVTTGDASVGQVATEIVSYQPPVDASQTGQLPEQEATEPQVGPDAVVIWAPPAEAGEVALALRDQGYEGPLYLDSFAAGDLFLSGDQASALDGARMIFTETLVIDDTIAISPAKTARQSWFRAYTAQYGSYHAYSSFAADAVSVIVDAVDRSGVTDRERVRNAMEFTLLDGLSGTIRFNTENHSGLAPQALTTVVAEGDRWRLAG